MMTWSNRLCALLLCANSRGYMGYMLRPRLPSPCDSRWHARGQGEPGCMLALRAEDVLLLFGLAARWRAPGPSDLGGQIGEVSP